MKTPLLEVLDQQPTPLGMLVLWRRRSPAAGGEIVYEMKIDGEHLMSSAVHESEVALATEALAAHRGPALDVLVGGLGLGYSAAAALDDERVRSIRVVELLAPVIDWHRRGLVPLGPRLSRDPRCRFDEGDFFDRLRTMTERFDLILIDIDHSPEALLRPEHAAFYASGGLHGAHARLRPGGLLALWSADEVPSGFAAALEERFQDVWTRTVEFVNPSADVDDRNYIVLARRAS